MNDAVARRLNWIPDERKRRAAAERFASGESVEALAREYEVPGGPQAATRTEYCLKQQIVEDNPRLWLPASREAVIEARQQPDHSDWAWLACRAHMDAYLRQRGATAAGPF